MFLSSQAATAKYSGSLNAPYLQDSSFYMGNSAGQYATLDRFALSEKLFGADDRFGTAAFNNKSHADFVAAMTDVITQAGGSLTVQGLKAVLAAPSSASALSLVNDFRMDGGDFEIGITQPIELMGELLSNQISISDFTDWTYVYGTSEFAISGTTEISLGSAGLLLTNALVSPVNDDFNFESEGDLAKIFNSAWGNSIEPNGSTFDILYDSSHAAGNTIASFEQSDFDIAASVTNTNKNSVESLVKAWWSANNLTVWQKLVDEPTTLFNSFLFFTTYDRNDPPQDWENLANEDLNQAIGAITAFLIEPELESDISVNQTIELNFGNLFNAGTGWFTDCFPVGTPISMVDGSLRAIERIQIGDIVKSFDADGHETTGIVDKLFTSSSQEFINLSFADGREGLTTTPGHRFLTEAGDYMEIGHMLRLGGGSVRLTDADGSIVEASGEVIAYSAETAHLFPEAQTKTIAMQGNVVLKEQVEAGWQTYNFEVRTHHNYVAGGIRVHNDSILSTLQEGDQLVALSDDLADAAVLRDVNGDGVADFVVLDGYRVAGEATAIAVERHFYWNEANGDLAQLLADTIDAGAAAGYDAVSNVFDPTAGQDASTGTVNDHGTVTAGNTWDDGAWGDDIEEAFFDDVLKVDSTIPTSIGFSSSVQFNDMTPSRAIIDGLYAANGAVNVVNIAGEIFSSISSETDLLGSAGLVSAIAGQVSTSGEALNIAAWLLGIEQGSLAYFAMALVLESAFEDALNTAPVPVPDDVLTVDQDGSGTSVDVLENDTDDDGDTLSITGTPVATNGTVVDNGDGTLTYTPNAGYFGVDTITYEITDGTDTITATLDVTVTEADPTVNGTDGDDTIDASFVDADGKSVGDGDDVADGGLGSDVIETGLGNDTLIGGEGDNTLRGGAGDDLYVSTSATDFIGELSDEGDDTLEVNYSLNLRPHIENLVLNGAAGSALTALGNSLDNTIIGDVDDNDLNGKSGANTIDAGEGNDTLRDSDGGDVLTGGAGDDVYRITGDDLGATVIVEAANGGIDLVISSADIVLADNVENALLTGLTDANVTGNALANNIAGNNGENVLSGEGGNDTLLGNSSDDTLHGGGDDDLITGGIGYDVITGGAGNDSIDGGINSDTIDGGDGADTINGGVHNDSLTGGTGADVFVFEGAFGLNRISDFEVGTDVIDLTGLSAVNGGNALEMADLLITQVTATQTRIQLDLDRDGVVDAIDLNGDGSNDNARIDLENFDASNLDATDFLF